MTADRGVRPGDVRPVAPDLACPKCGSADVTLTYQAAELYPSTAKWAHGACVDARGNRRGAGLPEHFHRACQRCHYRWPTFDVLAER